MFYAAAEVVCVSWWRDVFVSYRGSVTRYKSLDEALTHGGIDNKIKVNLVRIDSEKLKVSEIKKRWFYASNTKKK